MTRLRPPPGSKVREKQGIVRHPLIWFVAAATLVVTGTADNLIHPTATQCKTSPSTKELTCHFLSGKKYTVLNFNWTDYKKVTIYGNGSSIFLMHPLCLEDTSKDKKRELHINDASKVETAERADECAIQLILTNCTDVTIVGGADLVRMYSSHADKVILPKVTQFDLEEDSSIGEVSLVVTGGISDLKNSTIDLVTKLDIQGQFSFKMINCELGRVNNFILNNTHNEIQMEELKVGHVSPGGMVFVAGVKELNSINFNVVEQEGIQVLQEASLTFNYGKINTFSDGSIAVGRGATLELHNVTLGEKRGVSFKFSKASFKAYPLVFLKHPWVAPMGWIAIGVAVGLLVGFVATVVLMRFVKKGSFSVGGSETSKLLSQEEPAPQAEKQHKDPPFKKHDDAPKTLPAPPNRPLPNVPGSRVSQNEYYDDVLATASPLPPSDTPHPPPIAQRPPCALPKEQAKPSRSLNIKDRFRGKASFLPPVMKHNKHDSRDALPPPPPPDEELYDDPGDMTLQFPPQPPPASRQQPVPPPPGKPLPLPPDGEELYDDVQDMGLSQWPPAPPPSVNKPVLAKGKPKPPPPSRKPNRY